MINWEIAIIPLIAFGAWILSTIFKGNEEDKTKSPPRRPASGRIPRRPPGTLDKFLEETRRRRDRPAEPAEREEPRRPVSQPSSGPRRPGGQRRPAPILATIIEEPPRPVVVRQAVAVEKVPEPLPVPVSPPLEALPPLPPLPPMVRSERAVSPALQEVVRLLRSPKTASTAIVLREILDRPGGRRRR